MGVGSSIRNFFSGDSNRVFTLAKSIIGGVPSPLGIKTTPEIQRINPQYLEQVYIESPVIFNTINKIVQIIMSSNYHLEGDKKTVAFFEEFIDNIGFRGGENDWVTLIGEIFKFQCIYGYSPVELIYGKDSKEIVDLDIIDPKKFDYAKTGSFVIALDKFGNPVGYVETIPSIVQIPQPLKIQPPEGVTLMGNQIFFPPERIAYFKLYTIGDGFYPIGLVEPIYKTYIRQKATEDGFANASYRLGFPLAKAEIGDALHEPTEQQLREASEELKDINSRTSFAHAYYNKLTILESKHPERLKEYLNYWVEQEITGMGMPKALATGAGEATNRATLARQEYIAKMTLKDIVKRTTMTIESKIFFRIAELHNISNPKDRIGVPKIIWGEIALEELDSKCKRLVDYAKAKLLTPTPEIEKWIKQNEELPE